MNTRSLYWLSGLLEGEGYFGLVIDGSAKTFRIQVCSTDQDVIEHASNILLGYDRVTVSKPKWYRHKDYYQVNVNGSLAIQWMMTLYSLMSARRRSKIKEIVESWKSYRIEEPKCPKCNGKYTIRRYKSGARRGESFRICLWCTSIRMQKR